MGGGEAKVNILFCGDANVCDGIFLSTLSLCKHTAQALDIYILTASIPSHSAIPNTFAEKLRSVVQRKNKDSKVHLIDASDVFGAYQPTANMDTRFTPYCMLRLFADMLPQVPDRILYLDTDVLCRADFGMLYHMDISRSEIAGVPDRYGKWFFGNILKHDYLNSGVLLMNMANIRQSGLFQKCREMCRDKKMFMPDQSALNKLAAKETLPRCFNEQGKIRPDTVFKHFTTFFKFFPYFRAVTIKPWHTDRLHRKLKIFEFDDILDEFQRSNQNEQRDPDLLYNR